VETLCDRAVLLRDGGTACDGPSREVVRAYLEQVQAERLATDSVDNGSTGDHLEIVRVSVHDASGSEVGEVASGHRATIRLHYRAPGPIRNPIFSIGLSDGRTGCFALATMLVDGEVPDVIEGEGHVDCTFAGLPLHPRAYEVWGSVRGEAGFGDLVGWQRLGRFRVVGGAEGRGKGSVAHSLSDAPVKIPYEWKANGVGRCG
jgi:hypothetical protein